VLGIGHLHKAGFVYRDLKPENVLFDERGHVKLTDFGYAKNLQGTDRTSTFCGTADYLAPEVLQSLPYGKGVDWWSLGCVIYEMLVGISPFFNPNLKRMYRAILNDEVRFPAAMSQTARDIVTRLLRKNHAQRLGNGPEGAREIQGHPFFQSISWQAVFERKIEPQWKPNLESPKDVKNFAPEFTAEDPVVSFAEKPVIEGENPFEDWDNFRFTMTNDSAIDDEEEDDEEKETK